jgi:hypothetical protein
MRASQHRDQRRRRERRRLARITVVKEVEAGLSPVSLFNTATPQPPRLEEERSGPAAVPPPTLAGPIWLAGDRVHWHGYIGMFLRDTDDDDGTAEVLIGVRSYRVPRAELRSA